MALMAETTTQLFETTNQKFWANYKASPMDGMGNEKNQSSFLETKHVSGRISKASWTPSSTNLSSLQIALTAIRNSQGIVACTPTVGYPYGKC